MSYGITALVAKLSSDVVSELAAAGYPPLVDGGILLGKQHAPEESSPPRIVLTPAGSLFGPVGTMGAAYLNPASPGGNQSVGTGLRSVAIMSKGGGYVSPTIAFSGGGGSGATATAVLVGGSIARVQITASGSGYTSPPTVVITDASGTNATAEAVLLPTAEYRAMKQQKALYTEGVVFECRCWGVTPGNSDGDTDYDYTQQLYQQVIRSAHGVFGPSFHLVDMGGGKWTEASPGATQLIRYGLEHVLRFAIHVPVLDYLLPYAAPPVAGSVVVIPNGSTSDEVTVS